jgi:hypothetical protein
MKTRIVILGGCFGGVYTALEPDKTLAASDREFTPIVGAYAQKQLAASASHRRPYGGTQRRVTIQTKTLIWVAGTCAKRWALGDCASVRGRNDLVFPKDLAQFETHRSVKTSTPLQPDSVEIAGSTVSRRHTTAATVHERLSLSQELASSINSL